MITTEQITEIGRFNQPHGIKGEINAVISEDVDIEKLSCIILNIDGIFVPFFISGVRKRGVQSFLITVDGVDCEQKAALLTNKTIYALIDDAALPDSLEDVEGFYAEDLIGFNILSQDKETIGTVVDIDDSTENVLFIVETTEGMTRMIPVADEFITEIDVDNHRIIMNLPEGLLDI